MGLGPFRPGADLRRHLQRMVDGDGEADPAPALNRTRDDAAVSIPMTWPAALTSGPPESPGCRAALVWMRPLRFSAVPAVDRWR